MKFSTSCDFYGHLKAAHCLIYSVCNSITNSLQHKNQNIAKELSLHRTSLRIFREGLMKEVIFMNYCPRHLKSNMNPRIVSRKILCTYCQMPKELFSPHDTSGSRTYSELQRSNLVYQKIFKLPGNLKSFSILHTMKC